MFIGCTRWTGSDYLTDPKILTSSGDTDTLRYSAAVRDTEKLDFTYVGLSARYVYPLSKRTSLYAGAGYAEEKAESDNADLTADSKIKIGQAYAGITHKF